MNESGNNALDLTKVLFLSLMQKAFPPSGTTGSNAK